MDLLKVGDKVRVGKAGFCGKPFLAGAIGKVIYLNKGAYYPLGLEFEICFSGGHDCNVDGISHGRDGHCRWGDFHEVKKVVLNWDE